MTNTELTWEIDEYLEDHKFSELLELISYILKYKEESVELLPKNIKE